MDDLIYFLQQCTAVGATVDKLVFETIAKRSTIQAWMATRTDFATITAHLGYHVHENPTPQEFGLQRQLWATPTANPDVHYLPLLIQVVSYPHHEDWEPRPATSGRV